MADTNTEAKEKLVEQDLKTIADAPKKGAVPGEKSHIEQDFDDLGSAVVSPVDPRKGPSDANKDNKPVKQVVNAKALPGHQKANDDTEAGVQKADEPSDVDGPDKAKVRKTTSEAKTVKKEEEKPSKKVKADGAIDEKEVSEKIEPKVDEKDIDKRVKDIDVKEDVAALVDGDSDLSDEFKLKAATIFESAVKAKVKDEIIRLEKEYNKKIDTETSKLKEGLVEKVDSYLNYVVEEWMKENELAIERGIKGEIAEDFISGLKKLFEDHYIDVPDEKYNILEDQASKIENLDKTLNEQIDKNVTLNKEVGSFKRDEILSKSSKDLADTQKEKFSKLAENIEYKDAEDFEKKVSQIKESYFPKKSNAKSDDVVDDISATKTDKNLNNAMSAYSAAISKTKDIKLSTT